jgi:protein-disulfide isomerase
MAKRKKKKPVVPVPQPRQTPGSTFGGLGRKPLYIGALGVAAAIAAVLIAVSVLGGGGKGKTSTVSGVSAAKALFAGIPQSGNAVGSRRAPVTLVEYADPQCPFCAEWDRNALPVIVKRYVRPGRVRIEYRGLAFIGSDSTTALAATLAAGRQDKFWQAIDLLYKNQGGENSGWVSDSLLHSVARVLGLDLGKFDADRASPAVSRTIDRFGIQARTAGVSSTPTFFVGKTGTAPTRVEVTSLDAAGITPALDRALGR